jgi:hypothetical protein
MVLAPQQISLVFRSRFSPNLESFSRSSVFCDFLIWGPFFGQPWTNLISSFWFLVAQSDWKIDFLFLVKINLHFQIPKPPSPVQEPRKIPQMIHQNSIGFKTSQILQIPLKKVSIPSTEKINQNSPNFSKLSKSCNAKKID